ncbi:hypothetical protein [Leucobacter sp. Psy1]|uniref:hypothetical protein n=1 Tax=Leucobacter sp. Psy1 TaxID=2875729 RepID=UPI001CD1B52E|nr:hypothetical protein [Leucobacter sp. Psy1]
MMTSEQMLDPSAWRYQDAREAVDMRDRDRSALSDVPKQSGFGWSHHHRKFRSRGGDDSPANLVGLLGTGTTQEHNWVHTNILQATVLGYAVPSWADPATTPIFRIDAFGMAYGWFLQTVDGQLEPCGPPDYEPEQIAAALDAFEELRIKSRLEASRHL